MMLLPLLLASSLVSVATLEKRATCTVASNKDSSKSDVPAITAALQSCGTGGIIVLSKGITYAPNEVLDISACKSCEIQLEGVLKLSQDLKYWEGKRGAIYTNGMIGATIHSATGYGVVDGNGQKYWEVFSGNSSYKRPTMWYMSNVADVTISNIAIKNPPNVFHSVVGSKRVTYYNNTLTAKSTNSSVNPKNTDGWDTTRSSFVTISHWNVINQDDCVAFKGGSDYITVDTLTCTGSHGVSVGSLAKSPDNNKVYQGGSSTGTALVKNVTYDGVVVDNCGYAVQIQTRYGSASTADCVANPSKTNILDFYVKNISGQTSGKTVVNLNCPAAAGCDVHLQNFKVTANGTPAAYLCSNVDTQPSLGVNYTGAATDK